jgi:hypothetical protein
MGPIKLERGTRLVTMATVESTLALSITLLESTIKKRLNSCNKEFGIDKSPSINEECKNWTCMPAPWRLEIDHNGEAYRVNATTVIHPMRMAMSTTKATSQRIAANHCIFRPFTIATVFAWF